MEVTGPAQVAAPTLLAAASLEEIAAELRDRAEGQRQALQGPGEPPRDPTLQAAALMQAAGVQLIRAAAREQEVAAALAEPPATPAAEATAEPMDEPMD